MFVEEMQMPAANDRPTLPPLASVNAALRAITEHLAHELATPQPAAPGWSEFEWRVARAVAAMHGISGLLAGHLRWRGPDGWAAFLGQQREHIARRQLRVEELLAAIGERFRCCGIPAQAVKGAALHVEGLYQQGQRPMADLDLLTSPQHLVRASEILETLGLHESLRTFKHRVFQASVTAKAHRFGEHADNDLKVELHDRICEPLPRHLTDITQQVWLHEALPGLNPYPSRAAFMAHLLLHTAGGMTFRAVRLIQLYDIALLARRLTATDWEQLLEWRPWWAWPPLCLAERYFGALGAPAVTPMLRGCCPPLLRRMCARQRLSDVSLSRLWLEAFPGIEWAHSVGELVTLMARRIVPSAEARAERNFAVTFDPALAQDDWGRLSQTRKILRALSARTPRSWPLHNVRAALAEPY